MQALNDPEPEPLSLLAESDGLLPHAVRARVTAATLVSTAPVRFRCTDFILSSSGPAPQRDRRCAARAGSGRGCAARATVPTVTLPHGARAGLRRTLGRRCIIDRRSTQVARPSANVS